MEKAKVYFTDFRTRLGEGLPSKLKRLMKAGSVLFADDVLLYGWVSGAEPTPPKRRSIVDKIRGYLKAVTEDTDFLTSVLDIGDGVALSVLVAEEAKNEGNKR